MSTTGSVSLKILGDKVDLDFDNISKNLNLLATYIYKRGVIYSKVIGETENDAWYYELDFTNEENPSEVLEKLLSSLVQHKHYINDLCKTAYISIRYALQSEMAQIYFDISPKAIEELSKLGIPLEISIISWGGVES